jgi:hypothetical protein
MTVKTIELKADFCVVVGGLKGFAPPSVETTRGPEIINIFAAEPL